jgi:hypothetical protein
MNLPRCRRLVTPQEADRRLSFVCSTAPVPPPPPLQSEVPRMLHFQGTHSDIFTMFFLPQLPFCGR